MRERGGELEALGAAVVAVTFEPPERVRAYVEREGVPFPVLSDPDRRAYDTFGLKRGRASEVWTLGSLRAYLRNLLRGRLPRLRAEGDLRQLGGDFVLDAAGRVRWAYRSKDSADRPSPAEVLRAVRRVVAISSSSRNG